VADADALGRPRGSVLAFGGTTHARMALAPGEGPILNMILCEGSLCFWWSRDECSAFLDPEISRRGAETGCSGRGQATNFARKSRWCVVRSGRTTSHRDDSRSNFDDLRSNFDDSPSNFDGLGSNLDSSAQISIACAQILIARLKFR
jgi:hypothetical protein